MFKTTLSPDQLTQFSDIHTSFIPKRKKRFETYDILYPTSRAADKNKEVYTRINPILKKSIFILQSNNITDFDEQIYSVEFHQRNCGFEKKKHDWSGWHKDDHANMHCNVYTVLFYLRKDKTVEGGNLEYIENSQKKEHTVKSGDVLQFKGNMRHKPQATSGFGCRDIIVVFIKRK